jgi:hypothetical protein
MATHDCAQDSYSCDYCGVLYTSSSTSHCQCLKNHRFELENEIERLNKEIEDMRKMFDKALDGIYKDLGAISKRV